MGKAGRNAKVDTTKGAGPRGARDDREDGRKVTREGKAVGPKDEWRRHKRKHEASAYSKQFNNAVRDLRALSMPLIGKHLRKDYETAKIKALGGWVEKKRKMPLPELQSRRAAADRNVKRMLDRQEETGLKMRINKARDLDEALRLRAIKEKRYQGSIHAKKRAGDRQAAYRNKKKG